MGILSKKIWRYIARNLGQFLAAAAVVMGGIIIYVAMSSAYYNLGQAREAFYQENNFADYYFNCVKAPDGVVKQIEKIPGVKAVSGRIQKDLAVIKDNDERATARLVSYSFPADNEVNRINIVEGQLFTDKARGGMPEVVLDPRYFASNGLHIGDEVAAVVGGKQAFFIVVGTAIGPEFIYAMKDSTDILPDHGKFGIFMLENRQAQQILNMPGQINQLLIQFEPGAEQTKVIANIEEILTPYGLLTSFPRSDQLSDAVVDGELKELRSVATVLPLIFLAMAAAVQFIILRRLVKKQRSQIGLMKGMGYHNYEIMLHYIYYALAICLVGATAGVGLGIPCSMYFARLYNTYFNLPGDLQGIVIQPIAVGMGICLLVGLAAGLTASQEVAKIQPASSMRQEAPKVGSRSWLECRFSLLRKLNISWKMTLRNMNRNRGRVAVTLLGVMFAVGLLVCSFFLNDAVDYMMKKTFYEDQGYDMTIRFESMQADRELLGISRIDGVQKVEPFIEIPVKIHYQGRSEAEILTAYGPELSMKKLEDDRGQLIRMPAEGILLNQKTAEKLRVAVGEEVEVETLLTYGPVHWEKNFVAGKVNQMVGIGSYIDIQQANQILQERNLISGAMLKIDQGKSAQVETEINKLLEVSSVLSHQKEVANWERLIETMDVSIGIISLFGIMLGFVIVYNSSVMNMADRRREIGYMRAIGFSSREISQLLFKENMIYLILGIALGLPFGYQIAKAYVQSVSSDLYTLPVMIYPRTYVLAALGGIVFILIAHFLSTRGIKDMDLVEVLKSPE